MFDISLLEKEKVDTILIPGDICHSHLSKEAFDLTLETENINAGCWDEPQIALELLRKLPQIAPTFLSIGNHESDWNYIDKQFVRETGTILLDNEFVKVKDVIICGISSPTRHSSKNQNVPKDVNGVISDAEKEDGTKILLLHEPHLYYSYGISERKIDLVISGHAHGGQWRFFNRGVFAPGQGLFPKYTKGLYDNKLLVSAGMSNTAYPIPRLFNPQEIVIIEPVI